MQKLLLVDDDPVVLAVTRALLGSPQRSIRSASSGEQALELLAVEPADVVVLDVEMPGLTGWETLTAIRRNPDLRDTRVILYTAGLLHPVAADQPGPDSVVSKQDAIRDLIDAINAPLASDGPSSRREPADTDRTPRFQRPPAAPARTRS